MSPKPLLFTVLFLAYCTKMGFSRKCRQCTGRPDDCNNMDAADQTCLTGQDKCQSMILKKDGKESRVYGCATQNDCDAAMKACTAVEKNNVRTKCTAKCCAEDNCNNPPNKDTNLKCYECHSATSMDDCVQNSYAVTCTFNNATCGKFTTEFTIGEKKVMVYRKGCRSKDACDKSKDVFGQACESGDTCSMDCCQTDLCNAGSFSTVSVISLFACALLAFLSM